MKVRVEVAKLITIKSLLPIPFPKNVWWWLKFWGRCDTHGVEIGVDHVGRRLYVTYLHLGPFTILYKVAHDEIR